MKVLLLLLTILVLPLTSAFAINFVSAETTITANTSYFSSQSHSPNSVEGILFVPDTNLTLISIKRNSTANAPFCIVYDGKTNATIVNTTWSNSVCNANNVSLTGGRLYRIGTGTNASSYVTVFNQTYSLSFNGTDKWFLKYYPGIGNITGGCFGVDCAEFYTISSTLYNIEGMTLGDSVPIPPSNGENLTIENLTARLVYTKNFSTEIVTKNLTLFSDKALIFRELAQSIWSPSSSTLNIASAILALKTNKVVLGTGLSNALDISFDSSGSDGNISFDGAKGFTLNSPTTMTGNLSVDQLVKLDAGALPACNSATNGSLARNVTGMLLFCTNGTRWQRIVLRN